MKLTQLLKNTLVEENSNLALHMGWPHQLKQDVDVLVKWIQEHGYPESFTVSCIYGERDDTDNAIQVTYSLNEKSVNDEMNWHAVTFEYELTLQSFKEINALTEKLEAELDKQDSENDEIENMIDNLTSNMHHDLKITMEFDSDISKVYGALE